MKRRTVLQTLALALATVATKAHGDRAGKMPVVGLLITHPPVTDKVVESVRIGLQKLGYEDGRNVRLEVRTALGQLDRVPNLARELVRLPADVIILVNEPALLAVRKETTSTPIVMVGYTDDPVSLGWIDSYRRPGGNVTGIFNVNSSLTAKRLEILKEALPDVSTVTVFRDPAFGSRQLDELQRAASILKLQIELAEVSDAARIESAFTAARKNNTGAVLFMWSPLFYVNRKRIAEFSIDNGLPGISDLDSVAEAGLMLSYGSDTYFPFSRAAYFVDRLQKGTQASELPVEQISRLKLVVNLKTAKAHGVDIPQSILLRADEVIR